MGLREYGAAVPSLESCKTRVLAHLRKLRSEQTLLLASMQEEARQLRRILRANDPGGAATLKRVTGLEASIRELERELRQEPVSIAVPPDISFRLGTAYLHVDRLELAEGELLAVLRTSPNAGEAHNNLAAFYLAQNRWEEAAEQVRLAEASGFPVSPQMKADIAAKRSR